MEVERHESRRERIAGLEQLEAPNPDELNETRDDLLGITGRELLFDAQRQVLEGEHRVLARFLQLLVEIDNSLARFIGGVPERPAPRATAGLRPLAAASPTAPAIEPAAEMRGQEDLRRDSVRALHDGPTQSIAKSASRPRPWSVSSTAVTSAPSMSWPPCASSSSTRSTRPRSSSLRSAHGPR